MRVTCPWCKQVRDMPHVRGMPADRLVGCGSPACTVAHNDAVAAAYAAAREARRTRPRVKRERVIMGEWGMAVMLGNMPVKPRDDA